MDPTAQLLQEVFPLGPEALKEALAYQRERGVGLLEALLKTQKIPESDLLRALAVPFHLPFRDHLAEHEVDRSLVSAFPLAYLKQQRVLPLRRTSEGVEVALSDPLNVEALEDLRLWFGAPILPVLVDSQTLLNLLHQVYETPAEEAEQVVEDLGDEGLDLEMGLEEPTDLMDAVDEAPIIRLVNSLLFRAVRQRASDIHFEPFEREIVVRFRIDGVLHNVLTLPKRFQASVVSRIKIMASLNIAERRLPQDGRFRIRLAGRDIDIRVSVIPTAFGERIVLRLLDKSAALIQLPDLGMDGRTLATFRRLIRSSHGILLVTGPTGSGKTTTLYAALSEINDPEKNILTIEDPVEYQIRGIGQIQVNPKIDLTFARGLRSILRQDPDVIMVGEIRDLETAEIAIQASLTGHLVFSTLHTNDAPGAVTRLVDMGVEPYLVSSSLLAILAQRLVRLLCPACRRPHRLTREEALELGLSPEEAGEGVDVFAPGGCAQCMGTGYRGRTGIYELLVVTEPLRELILRHRDATTLRNAALEQGMVTLRRDGARKVLAGLTSVEEVLRVTQDEIEAVE